MGFVDDLLGTSIFGPNAKDRAISAQQNATNQMTDVFKETRDAQMEQIEPWRQAGEDALKKIAGGQIDVTQDPGYQFRMNEGMKAINAAGAARGLGNSGATLKALARYGQDYGSQEYGKAYDRLAGLASGGYGAASQQAGYEGAYGQNLGQALGNMGQARAGAEISQSNMMGNLLGQGLGFMAGGAFGNMFGGSAPAAVPGQVSTAMNYDPMKYSNLS